MQTSGQPVILYSKSEETITPSLGNIHSQQTIKHIPEDNISTQLMNIFAISQWHCRRILATVLTVYQLFNGQSLNVFLILYLNHFASHFYL